MSPREKLFLSLIVVVYALIFVGSIALLSLYGEEIGLARGVGTWVWAGAMIALAVLLFGPFIARRTSGGRALLALALVLLAGAGVYAYVAFVMIPDATVAPSEGDVPDKPVG